jgi:hypothetical protein
LLTWKTASRKPSVCTMYIMMSAKYGTKQRSSNAQTKRRVGLMRRPADGTVRYYACNHGTSQRCTTPTEEALSRERLSTTMCIASGGRLGGWGGHFLNSKNKETSPSVCELQLPPDLNTQQYGKIRDHEHTLKP